MVDAMGWDAAEGGVGLANSSGWSSREFATGKEDDQRGEAEPMGRDW